MACTACGKCVQDAAPGLISVASGVAVVDYELIAQAEQRAVERCPTGAIVWLQRRAVRARAVTGRECGRMTLDLRSPSAAPKAPEAPPYPRHARRRSTAARAVVAMETAAGEAAGAYPITPSTQMGEGWAAAVAEGKLNVNGRRLLFFEPEGEHAAAAVTAGMSMTGLRATNFSSGQGIAYMHESLYAAVGKRLTYVLNVAARAMTKHALNVHAGHDDYHAVDDTGFFQLFAKDVQEVGRPQPDRAPDRRAVAQPGHLRAGRLPHEPRDRDAPAPGARRSSRRTSAIPPT